MWIIIIIIWYWGGI